MMSRWTTVSKLYIQSSVLFQTQNGADYWASIYRVTNQVMQNLDLKNGPPGQGRPGQNGTFVLKSMGGFAQTDLSPCRVSLPSVHPPSCCKPRSGTAPLGRGWALQNCHFCVIFKRSCWRIISPFADFESSLCSASAVAPERIKTVNITIGSISAKSLSAHCVLYRQG